MAGESSTRYTQCLLEVYRADYVMYTELIYQLHIDDWDIDLQKKMVEREISACFSPAMNVRLQVLG
jgi:hypothetical protein